MEETTDFGAPAAFGKRHFYVDIPRAPREAVGIFEDFGLDDTADGKPVACRLVLARELWSQIKDDARRAFNARLKAKKLSVGTWHPGKVKLDRFLGRELCVLAWASEHASPEECPVICQKWLALRPEERWWLYSKAVSEAGNDGQAGRGWRKALYCALSDGDGLRLGIKVEPKKKRGRPKATEPVRGLLSMLDANDRGNI